MIKNITATKTSYQKQGKKWIETEKEVKTVNEDFTRNVIDAKRFFTNLGGYERHEKNYTKYGFRVVRVISISPSRDLKSIYEFDFNNAD